MLVLFGGIRCCWVLLVALLWCAFYVRSRVFAGVLASCRFSVVVVGMIVFVMFERFVWVLLV